MRLHVVLELHGRTATGFEVPATAVDELGGGRRPPVKVTINGFTYRSTVAPMGGRFLVGVSAENRAGAGVGAGDAFDVDLELDTAPRTVETPADLAAAIAAVPGLTQVWDALAFTHKREHVDAVVAAKKPETRGRRIEKAVEMLRAKAAK